MKVSSERYTTIAKPDVRHSTLKAVRHLKSHLKHVALKIVSYTLEVMEVEEASGVVQHHTNDAGGRELEFDLEMRLYVKITNMRDEKETFRGHIHFDVTDSMTDDEPLIERILWPQVGAPRGLAFTQCEGAIRSSRTRRMLREMITDFKKDFLHYESQMLIEGAVMHEDEGGDTNPVDNVRYSDTESESSEDHGKKKSRGSTRSGSRG